MRLIRLGNRKLPLTEEERSRAYQDMLLREAELNEAKARGVFTEVFSEKDQKVIDEVLKCSAIAKKASRTQVRVMVRDESGASQPLIERVGHEEEIFNMLLLARLQNRNGESTH